MSQLFKMWQTCSIGAKFCFFFKWLRICEKVISTTCLFLFSFFLSVTLHFDGAKHFLIVRLLRGVLVCWERREGVVQTKRPGHGLAARCLGLGTRRGFAWTLKWFRLELEVRTCSFQLRACRQDKDISHSMTFIMHGTVVKHCSTENILFWHSQL